MSGKSGTKGGKTTVVKKGDGEWKKVVAIVVGVIVLAQYCQSQSGVNQAKLAGTAVAGAGAYGAAKGLSSRGGGGGGAAGGGGGGGATAKEKESPTTTVAPEPPVTQPPAPPTPTPTTEPKARITVRPTPFGNVPPQLDPLPLPRDPMPMPAPRPIPGLAG